MQRRTADRLPHDVDARAQLLLVGELVDEIETGAEIDRQVGERLPLVL